MRFHEALKNLCITLACLFVAASCASNDSPDSVSDTIPTLNLTPEPVLEIGVVEGASVLELHEAISSIRLPDERIVVANSGSSELLFFDMTGLFLSKSGRRGGGPGEFRTLSRLYMHGTDSILALDKAGNRVSVLDARGNFGRIASAEAISNDSEYPMDVWLHRRFWVEGAFRPARRQVIREILDRLPIPMGVPAYRYVQADAEGNVWIREPLAVDAEEWHWTVVDSTGDPVAVVWTPIRFEPHHIGTDFVLGRWFGEDDVNFIRLYGLGATDDTTTPPEWMTGTLVVESQGHDSNDEEERLLSELRASLSMVVTAQEMYYADHGTYSQSRHALTWDPPESVSLDIIFAYSRGWSAVAIHTDLPRICGMAVGSPTPPGWNEGEARCSHTAER